MRKSRRNLAALSGRGRRPAAALIVSLLLAALAASPLLPSASGAQGANGAVANAAASARNLRLLGFSDLGRQGLNGDVAVVGNTAIVATGLVTDTGDHTERYNPLPCLTVSVKVVDLSNPARPTVASTIPLPAGVAAAEVDALRVNTRSFRGDLAAIALDDGPSHTGPTTCTPSPANVERGAVYYDVSNPAQPRLLGRYHADERDAPPEAPPCGLPPQGGTQRCATGQHAVDLVRRSDGRVLSLTTEPGTYLDDKSSGPLRVVDVTDPRSPVEVGSWPPRAQRPPLFSNNGCRPASSLHSAEFSQNGRTAFVAFMDDGLFTVDVSRPSSPRRLAQLEYARTRRQEGNAAYVTTAKVGGRTLALLSEEDWAAPDTSLQISAPASLAGSRLACEGMFTLFDRDRDAQIYLRPQRRVAGDIAYVGRGCPARGTTAADPYLADPAGKIAFVDRSRIAATQPNIPEAPGCRGDVKVRRAQEAGALAVIAGRVIVPPFAPAPYAVAPGGDPTGLRIPSVEMDTPDSEAIRSALCPSIDSGGNCVGGQRVTGALVDDKGEWGALRVIDVTRPSRPRQVALYRTPTANVFPPRDLGIYAPHHVAAANSLAYVAANSDGLRVLDLKNLRRGRPREVASFVPDDSPDPTGTIPGEAYVRGVALAGRRIVITDTNSGLYVLELTRAQRSLSLTLGRHLVASGRIGLASLGPSACTSRVPVVIERDGREIKRVVTSARGAFRTSLPDRPGRYRAVASSVLRNRVMCERVASPVRRHGH